MQENRHTSGPWLLRLNRQQTAFYIETEAHQQHSRPFITSLSWWSMDNDKDGAPTRAETEANAHLIAAAPELLEACRALLFIYETGPAESNYAAEVADRARVATAKALNISMSEKCTCSSYVLRSGRHDSDCQMTNNKKHAADCACHLWLYGPTPFNCPIHGLVQPKAQELDLDALEQAAERELAACKGYAGCSASDVLALIARVREAEQELEEVEANELELARKLTEAEQLLRDLPKPQVDSRYEGADQDGFGGDWIEYPKDPKYAAVYGRVAEFLKPKAGGK